MKKLGIVLLIVLTNLVTWGLSNPIKAERCSTRINDVGEFAARECMRTRSLGR